MRHLLEGLDRLLQGNLERLDRLWQQVSEVVKDDAGCPQTVANDLLALFRRVANVVWSLDSEVGQFREEAWRDWNFSVGRFGPEGSVREGQRLPINRLQVDSKSSCLRDVDLAEGFVHLHNPQDHVCYSAAYRAALGGESVAFYHYGFPMEKARFVALSEALNAGVQKAFSKVEVTPPPSMALRQDDGPGQVYHPPPSDPTAGRVSRRRVLECCHLDTETWVHVHLPVYGLCWTFDWNRARPSFPQMRVGTASVGAVVDLTVERKIRLRTALERWISDELRQHYGI